VHLHHKEAGMQLQSYLSASLGLIPYELPLKFGIYKKLTCRKGRMMLRVVDNFDLKI